MTTAQFTTRPTYPQDWPAYNAAQTAEKDTFVSLPAGLRRYRTTRLQLRTS